MKTQVLNSVRQAFRLQHLVDIDVQEDRVTGRYPRGNGGEKKDLPMLTFKFADAKLYIRGDVPSEVVERIATRLSHMRHRNAETESVPA